MDLLPQYNSNLPTFQYLQLLQLLEANVAQGEYAAGTLFDVAAGQALQQQAQDFTSLSLPSAGQRSDAYSLNYPLSLLIARYAAMTSECADFTSRLGGYMSVLEKDSALVDFLLAAARLRAWVASRPQLGGAASFSWDFTQSLGPRAALPLVDPQNPTLAQPASSAALETAAFFSAGLLEGAAPPANTALVAPTEMSWTCASTATTEILSGADWAKLSVLENAPLLVMGSPVTSQLTPQGTDGTTLWSNFFAIGGISNTGNLPVFVETTFLPRRSSRTVTLSGPLALSAYQVMSDDLIVYNSTVAYAFGVDYTLSDAGVLTPASSLLGQAVTILFTEYFPAFHCSINGSVWSQYLMLDPLRPYPDDATSYAPIELPSGLFAITDELGAPLGLTLQMVSAPSLEYLLRIEQVVASGYGESATLEIDFPPSYLNGLRLAPAAPYPATIQGIQVFGVSDTACTQIFQGSLLLDRDVTFRFDRTLVRRALVFLRQEGYTLNQHQLNPPDFAKRSLLAQLQAVLPFSVQSIAPPASQLLIGAQYDFGLRDVAGVNSTTAVVVNRPGILISGPYSVTSSPEVLRFDAVLDGEVGTYLEVQETYDDGTLSAVVEMQIAAPCTLPYTPLAPSAIETTFWLKFILRSEMSIAERFLLQVATS